MVVTKKKLEKAFPKELSKDVERITELLKIDDSIDNVSNFTYEISFKGQILMIPYRIYFDENIDVSNESLTVVQKNILNCIGLRHLDGRVRERYLKRIGSNYTGFEVPYIFQLLGEYVLEIIEIVNTIIVNDRINDYLDFVIENPKYFKQTESRMISYWNCYYRRQYWKLKNYPGYKIINQFKKDLNIYK